MRYWKAVLVLAAVVALVVVCGLESCDTTPKTTHMSVLPRSTPATVGWGLVANNVPSWRKYACMVYDSNRQVGVLFGGQDYPRSSNEVWEWSGFSWSLVDATGPYRSEHAMAFDSARNVVVMNGGSDQTGPVLDGGFETVGPWYTDTWEWNGTTWSLRTTAGPGLRVDHAMAFDSGRGVTVLFGGYNADNDTWEWDGTTWTQEATSGPAARGLHGMAYDAARGVTVLFGGRADAMTLIGDHEDQWESQVLADTWEWDGTAWTQIVVDGPDARASFSFAYDPDRQVCLLFGGENNNTPQLYEDTWEWNGTTWTQGAETAPNWSAGHCMIYDSQRNNFVLYACFGTNSATYKLFK